MICLKCKGFMIIDEWDGWTWICVNCEYIGRNATDEEIEELEAKDVQTIKIL